MIDLCEVGSISKALGGWKPPCKTPDAKPYKAKNGSSPIEEIGNLGS